MDSNQKKEQFSRAFVQAVAAQVGYRTATPNVDDDSIDLIIKGKAFAAPIRNPQIEIQLKCTANDDENSDILKFALPIKNYNDLRGDDLLAPRYLFILVVPKECKYWIVQKACFTKLRHCCYWMSLINLPNVTNSTTVTLSIPKSQIVNAESLTLLMERASNREAA
jgi:hypothetical protein